MNRSKRPFTLIKNDMLWRDSDFVKLSIKAKMLWIYLRSKYNPNQETRNPATGEIVIYLTYSELNKIKGFHTVAIKTAFNELIKNNFIKVSFRGGLNRAPSGYTFIGKYSNFPNQRKK